MMSYQVICVSIFASLVLNGCQPVGVPRERIRVAEIIVEKRYEHPKEELEMCGRGIPCTRYRTVPGKWYVSVTGSVEGKSCDEVVIDYRVNLCLRGKRYVTEDEFKRLHIGDTLRTVYF